MHIAASVWHATAASVAVAGSLAFVGGAAWAAAPAGPPDLTVVGFGVVDVPPQKPVQPQLILNLDVHGSTPEAALHAIDADLGALRTRLGQLGLKGPAVDLSMTPQLNDITSQGRAKCRTLSKLKPGIRCPRPGYSANASLQVTFPSLASLARTLTRTEIATGRGVQNFYINQGGYQTAQPTQAGLVQGYRAALVDARQSAAAMASADGISLGPVLSITEGEGASGACGPMGGCGNPTGLNPPGVGPNQELVAVTVTYATRT